ncbi:MAG: hypothetical protein JWN82_113 [Candidatus Saccharibacteria bacterium]|nr:hypothetical protein [Candidatus Saccharibacteria bacterium]
MSKLTKIAAALAVVPMFAFSTPAFADVTVGQVETGNIYRVRNLSVNANGAFDENITATCGDTVQFRVRIHNTGPDSITNVKVVATLDGQTSKSHGSKVTVTADNNLHGDAVTASAGVSTDKDTSISYVAGSTELLDYSPTAGASNVIKALPDGITTTGVNIGTVGPLTPDTESVQFKAKLNCATTTTTTTTTKPAQLVKTGPADVAALFAVVAIAGAVAYNWVLRRQSAR